MFDYCDFGCFDRLTWVLWVWVIWDLFVGFEIVCEVCCAFWSLGLACGFDMNFMVLLFWGVGIIQCFLDFGGFWVVCGFILITLKLCVYVCLISLGFVLLTDVDLSKLCTLIWSWIVTGVMVVIDLICLLTICWCFRFWKQLCVFLVLFNLFSWVLGFCFECLVWFWLVWVYWFSVLVFLLYLFNFGLCVVGLDFCFDFDVLCFKLVDCVTLLFGVAYVVGLVYQVVVSLVVACFAFVIIWYGVYA